MNQTFKLISLLVVAIGVLLCYAFVPENIAEKLFLKQVSMDAVCQNNADTLAVKASQESAEKEPVDTAKQRILLFGDSMSQPLALRLADYANRNGHTLTCVTWVSSTTMAWADSDTLSHYMRSVRPTHVFVCLGSNELYTVDQKGSVKRIRSILAKIGNVPTVWIGPPNWCEDKGYNKWLLEELGPKRYYPSYKLTFERQKDGRHPTQKASSMWMDKIVEWMNAGHSIHPFVMEKPEKQDRHYKQVVILPHGTKHGAVATEAEKAEAQEASPENTEEQTAKQPAESTEKAAEPAARQKKEATPPAAEKE